jgi:2,4-dienoyl-CoA reductase-like NADH-dependent reductase (Old Yellow Enzyme family)
VAQEPAALKDAGRSRTNPGLREVILTRGLFDTMVLGPMTLRNRIVRSATAEGMAGEDGEVTEVMLDLYRALAAGGAGLLVTGHAFVSPEGRAAPRQTGIHEDRLLPGLRRLARACHEAGAGAAVQLAHAGAQTRAEIIGGQAPVGPSALEDPVFRTCPREMNEEDISRTIEAFGRAAARAREAGFDAVEVHAAHGYLLSQFLSPLRNHRRDGYGGPVENRTRFTVEVYDEVRRAVGPDFPVLIKINGQDYVEGGAMLEDSLPLARELARKGIDAIEVSGGTGASGLRNPSRVRISGPAKEAYHLPEAREIRKVVRCPIVLVGGLRSPDRVLEVLEEGNVDLIALSRPLIRQPDLPAKWESGDRAPATCISCNRCFRTIVEGGLHCARASQ